MYVCPDIDRIYLLTNRGGGETGVSSIEVDAFLEAECFKINFLEAICYKIKNKKAYNRGCGETGVSSIEANAFLKAVCQRGPPLVLPCLQVSCNFVLGLVRLHCRCAYAQSSRKYLLWRFLNRVPLNNSRTTLLLSKIQAHSPLVKFHLV